MFHRFHLQLNVWDQFGKRITVSCGMGIVSAPYFTIQPFISILICWWFLVWLWPIVFPPHGMPMATVHHISWKHGYTQTVHSITSLPITTFACVFFLWTTKLLCYFMQLFFIIRTDAMCVFLNQYVRRTTIASVFSNNYKTYFIFWGNLTA